MVRTNATDEEETVDIRYVPVANTLNGTDRRKDKSMDDYSNDVAVTLKSGDGGGSSSSTSCGVDSVSEINADQRVPPQAIPFALDFAFEFDSEGILRHAYTNETLSMKAAFTGVSLGRQEMIRAIPGHPTLCLRVLHSLNLYTHTGPVLLVLQGGGVTQAGVWATRLLLHPQHGLRTGSQLELVRRAHAAGYAVALLNANEPCEKDAAAPMESQSYQQHLHRTAASLRFGLNPWSELIRSCPHREHSATRVLPPRPIPTTGYPTTHTLSKSGTVEQIEDSKPPILLSTDTNGAKASLSRSESTSSTCSNSSSALFSLLLTNPHSHPPPTPVLPTTTACLSDVDSNALPEVSAQPGQCDFIPPVAPLPPPRWITTTPPLTGGSLRSSLTDCETTFTSIDRSTALLARTDTLSPREEAVCENTTRQNPAVPSPSLPSPAKVNRGTASSVSHSSHPTRQNVPVTDKFYPPPSLYTGGGLTDTCLDVSLEDRLYGVWRHIVPRLASNRILVWAHQQGGLALLHPLKPMPGVLPGFFNSSSNPSPGDLPSADSASSLRPPCSDKVPQENGSTTVLDQRKSGQSAMNGNSNSRLNVTTSNRRNNARGSLGVPASDGSSIVSSVQPPTCHLMGNPRWTFGTSRPPPLRSSSLCGKIYPTRKRHMSANAVLSSSSSSVRPPASSSIEGLAQIGAKKACLELLVKRAVVDSRRGEATASWQQSSMPAQLQSFDSMRADSSSSRSLLSRRTRIPDADCRTPENAHSTGLPDGATRQSAKSCIASQPPPLGMSMQPTPLSTPSDERGLWQLRLAKAWQQKARRLFSDFEQRVTALVFTECPTVLDLAMDGIGWGTHLVVESDANRGESRLFRPSIVQKQIPAPVSNVRRWLAENSVHYVAADLPLGSQIVGFPDQSDRVPVFSSGTTEHDLIPAAVLDNVFKHFDSKLTGPNTMHPSVPSAVSTAQTPCRMETRATEMPEMRASEEMTSTLNAVSD